MGGRGGGASGVEPVMGIPGPAENKRFGRFAAGPASGPLAPRCRVVAAKYRSASEPCFSFESFRNAYVPNTSPGALGRFQLALECLS